jgi:hypothetical protein
MYEFLAHRDGEYCFIGGESGNDQTLVIDHADNDNSNNDPSNLNLICRSMNAAKNPRGRSRKKMSSVCVNVREELLRAEFALPSSAEFKKNLQSEPDFRHWLFLEIWRKGRLPLDEVIDCGAAVARCSQESIKRYLRKECSRVRLYEIVNDETPRQKFVQLRGEWEQHRQNEEKRRNNDRYARNWRKDQIKGVAFIEKDNKKKVDESNKKAVDESGSTAQYPPWCSGSFPRNGGRVKDDPQKELDFQTKRGTSFLFDPKFIRTIGETTKW